MKPIVLRMLLFGVLTVPLTAQSQLETLLSSSRLPFLKSAKLLQVSSYDTTGGNNDFVSIPKDGSVTIAQLKGPGIIVRIWVTVFSPDEHFLRRILVRMYWDDEPNPSVEVPVGDFFGTGFAYRHYVTPFLGMSSGGYYCFFPMPFNKSARIVFVNETGMEVNSLYYHINFYKLDAPLGGDAAYFHAGWKREPRTKLRSNYVILEAEGEGHVVGVNMSMQSYEKGLQYLEGDEMVYVDGEKMPSIYGTGTEDYFSSGWYFNRGEFASPYHGLLLKDDSLGRIAAYRFHILDAIPFSKSVRFTIEHGHGNEEVVDYSSTAYWYQKEPHKKFSEMPPPAMRIPLRLAIPNNAVEAEGSLVKSTCPTRMEPTIDLGAEWSSNAQLAVMPNAAGDSVSLTVPVAEESYEISLYFTKGPEYGNADIHVNGIKVGEISGYSKHSLPAKTILDTVMAKEGTVTVTVVSRGKDLNATGLKIGLDAFVFRPHRKFIIQWYLIGPFPNPRNERLERLGLDMVFPPEMEIDLLKSYPGIDGKPVAWTLASAPPSGRVNLRMFEPNELVVVYALTHIYSLSDQRVPLLLGSDDGVKVFLNDREIHRFLKVRISEPDQDTVQLDLKTGWNKLLLKIENNFGGYNFLARVIDPRRTLIVNPTRQK